MSNKDDGAVFQTSHPLDFNLYDSKDQNYVLYISDDPKEEHSLTLELRNTSSLALSFPDLGPQASNEANHFALVFRANTLSPKTIELLGAADKATVLTDPSDWDVALDRQRETVTLCFLYRGPNTDLASGDRRLVGLKQISAAAGRGARGTKVELKPRRVSYADHTPITGSRIQHLQIINQRGSQQMPVHVGFIGSNRILNDGSSSDLTLTLQVMNTANPAAEHLADPTIRLQAGKSKFILTFDVANDAGTPAWALCKQSEFDVKTTVKENTVDWKDDTAGQGRLKTLTWSPASDVTLNPGEAIEFSFTGFKSSLPAGPTNLYLHYQNVPGYWDGQFVCVIEKAPLLFVGGNVGVGVAAPTRKLEIAGTSGNVLWAGATTGSTANIELSGHVELREYSTQNIAFLQARDDSSNRDIGLRLRTQKAGTPANAKSITEAVTIDGSGNVGIGVAAPTSKLEIAGTDEGTVLWAGATAGSTANIELSGHVELREYSTENIAYLQARDDKSNRDIGLRLRTQKAGTPNKSITEAVTIDGSGNVGIGTITPAEKLQVNGRIRDQTGYVTPVGTIIAYAGRTAPEGWLICNGQSVPQEEKYQTLKNLIGVNTPNLIGRTLIGAGGSYSLGNSGGEERVILQVTEMPSHSHKYSKFPNQRGDIAGGSYWASGEGDTTPTGGNQSHNNMPPYYVVNYIIKY